MPRGANLSTEGVWHSDLKLPPIIIIVPRVSADAKSRQRERQSCHRRPRAMSRLGTAVVGVVDAERHIAKCH